MHFADDLIEAMIKKKSRLCVGLDPDPQRLPAAVKEKVSQDLEGVGEAVSSFLDLIIAAIAPHAVAVKPQLAYFELLGPQGLQLLKEKLQKAQEAGLMVILDGKRNDIGSTARAYAQAYLGTTQDFTGRECCHYFAQALTVNPFFGTDGLEPFFQEAHRYGKGVFILVKTSNPSSSELQDLILAGGETLSFHLAKKVHSWGQMYLGRRGYSCIGAVVGATAKSILLPLRQLMPQTIFLIPGLGAQGGRFADLTGVFSADGLGALVNVSRSILYSFEAHSSKKEIVEQIEDKARFYKEGLQSLHE